MGNTNKVSGFAANAKGVRPGEIWLAAGYNQSVRNQWSQQEYDLTEKAVAADRAAEIAEGHARMHENDARMFAQQAQKSQQQAELAARDEIIRKQPKMVEYVDFCKDLRVWLGEHKDRQHDPQMLKQLGLCGGIDSYLELATRDSIKATAHNLGYRLVGEEPGVAVDVERRALLDGYRPDFYRLHPAQVYTPASARAGINPSLEHGLQSMGKMEADMEKAVQAERRVEDWAVKDNIQMMRSPHQDLETLQMQRRVQVAPMLPSPPVMRKRVSQSWQSSVKNKKQREFADFL